MPTIEARLRRLHTYAVELRKLAYTLPNAVDEHIFLQLSERMSATRDEAVPSSTGPVIFRLDSEAAKAAVANMGPSVAGRVDDLVRHPAVCAWRAELAPRCH